MVEELQRYSSGSVALITYAYRASGFEGNSDPNKSSDVLNVHPGLGIVRLEDGHNADNAEGERIQGKER